MTELNRSAGVEETRESREEANDSEREIGRLAIAKHHARRAVENWISEEGDFLRPTKPQAGEPTWPRAEH